MSETVLTPELIHPPTVDRPGWIPPHITHDWDPDPYAYQTEEELMAAGGLHGRLLTYIAELVRYFIEGHGSMFLVDTFMLYRDATNVKQRVALDLLLMPLREHPPSTYDLDIEPVPRLVVEVASPSSYIQDRVDKVNFYAGLGIETYLVIDAITPDNRLREQIDLYLWRLVNGQPQSIAPASDGRLALPELGLWIWTEEQRIRFADLATDEPLRDVDELLQNLDTVERERDQIARELDAERQARLALEARLRELEAQS